MEISRPLRLQGLGVKSRKQKTRIQDLPNDIILRLTSDLSLRDIVNFSAVSKQWLNVPSCLEHIEFDISMLNKDKSSQQCLQNDGSFIRGVNQFLNHYVKLRSRVALPVSLRTFVIHFCLDRESSTHLDAWIGMAIRSGVSNLDITLGCVLHEGNRARPNEKKYIFPWLTVHEPPPELKRLSLHSCAFQCNLTSVWTSLESLHLFGTVLTQHDMDRILHCFPNLRDICIIYCKVPAKLLTFGGGSLSSLKVVYCPGLREIQVLDACSLREFYYKGISVPLKLINTRQVRKVTLGFDNAKYLDYIFQSLRSDFPSMTSLSLFTDIETLPPLSHLYGRMGSFIQLEELKLYCHPSSGFNLQTVAEVLKGCQSLKRLEMVPPCTMDAGYCTEIPALYPHKSLEFIKLSGFCGSCFNVKLAKFLVQVSESLVHIVIQRNIDVIDNDMYSEHGESWHGHMEFEEIKDVLHNSMTSGQLTFL